MASAKATGRIWSCVANSLTISEYCFLNDRLASLLPIVRSKLQDPEIRAEMSGDYKGTHDMMITPFGNRDEIGRHFDEIGR
jgi:hypothetical protein